MVLSEEKLAEFQAEFKKRVEAMTPEQRTSMVHAVCGAVNALAKIVVQNADALWANRHTLTQA